MDDTKQKWTLSIHAGFRAIVEKQPFADVRRRSENRRIIHVTNVADIRFICDGIGGKLASF